MALGCGTASAQGWDVAVEADPFRGTASTTASLYAVSAVRGPAGRLAGPRVTHVCAKAAGRVQQAFELTDLRNVGPRTMRVAFRVKVGTGAPFVVEGTAHFTDVVIEDGDGRLFRQVFGSGQEVGVEFQEGGERSVLAFERADAAGREALARHVRACEDAAPATLPPAAPPPAPQVAAGPAFRLPARIGPTFACPAAGVRADSLARLVCDTPAMSREDLMLGQAYYALRHSLGPGGWADLKAEAQSIELVLRGTCGFAPGTLANQPLPPDAQACYIRFVEAQRQGWVQRLSGVAREEAVRPVERHVVAQQCLVALGFASAGPVDGIYGAGVRSAIESWQRAAERVVTGFLSDRDVDLLFAMAAGLPK